MTGPHAGRLNVGRWLRLVEERFCCGLHGIRTILPWTPGSMIASWAFAASANGNCLPRTGVREPLAELPISFSFFRVIEDAIDYLTTVGCKPTEARKYGPSVIKTALNGGNEKILQIFVAENLPTRVRSSRDAARGLGRNWLSPRQRLSC